MSLRNVEWKYVPGPLVGKASMQSSIWTPQASYSAFAGTLRVFSCTRAHVCIWAGKWEIQTVKSIIVTHKNIYFFFSWKTADLVMIICGSYIKKIHENNKVTLKRLWTGDQNTYSNIFWFWRFLVKIFTENGGCFLRTTQFLSFTT